MRLEDWRGLTLAVCCPCVSRLKGKGYLSIYCNILLDTNDYYLDYEAFSSRKMLCHFYQLLALCTVSE